MSRRRRGANRGPDIPNAGSRGRRPHGGVWGVQAGSLFPRVVHPATASSITSLGPSLPSAIAYNEVTIEQVDDYNRFIIVGPTRWILLGFAGLRPAAAESVPRGHGLLSPSPERAVPPVQQVRPQRDDFNSFTTGSTLPAPTLRLRYRRPPVISLKSAPPSARRKAGRANALPFWALRTRRLRQRDPRSSALSSHS